MDFQTQTYQDKKLSQIVTENLKAAEVLEENNIDFCCGGDKTLEEACSEQNLSSQSIEEQLRQVMEANDSETEYIKNLNASELSDYIVKKHHAFVRKNIPVLKKYIDKISQVHGENHTELYDVKDSFSSASEALASHMEKEEKILFPYIHKMIEAQWLNREMKINSGAVDGPIQQMLHEHETEGERFDWLSEKTDNFKVPDDGCNTYHLTYKLLKEFKNDLHKHIHLENNILFPEAKRLEQELAKKER